MLTSHGSHSHIRARYTVSVWGAFSSPNASQHGSLTVTLVALSPLQSSPLHLVDNCEVQDLRNLHLYFPSSSTVHGRPADLNSEPTGATCIHL